MRVISPFKRETATVYYNEWKICACVRTRLSAVSCGDRCSLGIRSLAGCLLANVFFISLRVWQDVPLHRISLCVVYFFSIQFLFITVFKMGIVVNNFPLVSCNLFQQNNTKIYVLPASHWKVTNSSVVMTALTLWNLLAIVNNISWLFVCKDCICNDYDKLILKCFPQLDILK